MTSPAVGGLERRVRLLLTKTPRVSSFVYARRHGFQTTCGSGRHRS